MSKSDNTDTPTSTVDTNADVRLTGRVKWFNNEPDSVLSRFLVARKGRGCFRPSLWNCSCFRAIQISSSKESMFHSLYAIVITTIILTRLARFAEFAMVG